MIKTRVVKLNNGSFAAQGKRSENHDWEFAGQDGFLWCDPSYSSVAYYDNIYDARQTEARINQYGIAEVIVDDSCTE